MGDQNKRVFRAKTADRELLLTNYVMLELLLTRPFERPIINAARDLRFIVLDELHTYRGRQGADVALLVRRLRVACQAEHMLCVGTSATMSSGGTLDQQQQEVAGVATRLFGSVVRPENVISETLTRATVQADPGKPETTELLRKTVRGDEPIPNGYQAFVHSPLAAWLEDRLGLRREAEGGRPLRGR